ncbi:MAG: transcriptional regulator [Halieaceae bacterium]|jgi:nitrogen regulatory protein PII|uniref:P-II family nitrogen regulator n=1 Tax=Haliea TaxID=475794 RepID=UPI000C3D14D1|nr:MULTISPECIES: transcriptional regulator [Haliea]MCR9185798.1 transcriptional regulator [Halieaceae bacterium]MAD64208.1 transcriptional regulator [Haliea sp.]MAY94866.1 transcriptional regulator [Haliea sp.]MBK39839.1 transcriptional regulator [Haliea sp.]MBP69066.1 transcriptional regulator [Haliea sp.]|tara:strand:+ start:4367 stop:4669 length:303 start_codon:yes stop_codon:yes gene_type:complete
MEQHPRRLLTVVTESTIESHLLRDMERWGAHGYTITEARGKGARGVREGNWEANRNLRIEVVCDDVTADRIAAGLREHYYDNYAMILYTCDVDVLRPEKF